jgi:hypothetical protein
VCSAGCLCDCCLSPAQYRNPGSIQYSGPHSDAVTLTLTLEQQQRKVNGGMQPLLKEEKDALPGKTVKSKL